MKKFVSILAAALLVLGTVGQALAYFDDTHLIRVVYERGGTVETATDLGDINTLTAGTYAVDKFNLTTFGTGKSWANMYVAYFAFTYNEVFVSGKEATAPETAGSKYGTSTGAMSSVTGYYKALEGTADTTTAAMSNKLSYYQKLNGGSTTNAGRFQGYLRAKDGEAQLSDLANSLGSVTQILYRFNDPDVESTGLAKWIIKTAVNAQGQTYTQISSSSAAVPIPGAIWLLVSGLLGLIGIRRKIA